MESTMMTLKKTALAFVRVLLSFVIVCVVVCIATVCFILASFARSSVTDTASRARPDLAWITRIDVASSALAGVRRLK
jgi:hypothetical protein